ncbi:hypothetical protein HMPREF0105_1073 [Bacteroides sp. 3_1_33FAA]|nr:hypothetical protein HMPREF0105_1073 [Bacteroides sp. 3_1_33FAA]
MKLEEIETLSATLISRKITDKKNTIRFGTFLTATVCFFK